MKKTTISEKEQKELLLHLSVYLFNNELNKVQFCEKIGIHKSTLSRYFAFNKPNFCLMSINMRDRFKEIIHSNK